jgi:hypothetical protein
MLRLLISMVVLVAGCGGPKRTIAPPTGGTQQVQVAGPPFVAPGERMTYRVSLHDVTLASFAIVVGPAPSTLRGRQAIVVQAGAEAVGVAAMVKPTKVEFATWLDVANGASLLFRATETAGNGDQTLEVNEARFTELADGKFPISTSRPDASELIENQLTTQAPTDIVTMLMAARAWDGPIGTSRTLEVVRSRYMWRTQVTLAGRKPLVTELGQLPAVKFDAVTARLLRDGSLDKGTPPRHFSLWISDDADRVPLQLVAESDYGDIRMEIADYAAGTSPNLTGR